MQKSFKVKEISRTSIDLKMSNKEIDKDFEMKKERGKKGKKEGEIRTWKDQERRRRRIGRR